MELMELMQGRPTMGKRSVEEEACYDFLDSQAVSYQRVDHEALYTMEALAPVEQVLGCTVAKNLFLTNRQQTEFYLLLMPGGKPFKTKYLSAQLGCSRLSFGSEAQLVEYLGTTHGSASILGLLQDKTGKVNLIIDRDLQSDADFACHPCHNTSTLRFAFSELTEKIIPALGRTAVWVDLPAEME